MIRPATIDDLPRLLTFLKACFDEMDFTRAGHRWDPVSVWRTFQRGIEESTALAVVEDARGDLQGAALGFIHPDLMDYSNLFAVEIVWHADPALPDVWRARIMLRLLDAFEAWADSQKARLKLFLPTAGPGASIGSFLERHGYFWDESMYSRR